MHAKDFVTNEHRSQFADGSRLQWKDHGFGLRRSTLVSWVISGKLGSKAQSPLLQKGGNKAISVHSAQVPSLPGCLPLLFPCGVAPPKPCRGSLIIQVLAHMSSPQMAFPSLVQTHPPALYFIVCPSWQSLLSEF